jgi:hypothetical protein
MAENDRRQISYGHLIAAEDFDKSPFIPLEVKKNLKKGKTYLFIYIPGEEILKLSIFPCENATIKKILIRLKEFSPDLVKGISDVLKNFNLGDSTIHTTGLCFSGVNCFYETYIDSTKITTMDLSLDKIKENFLKVPRVENVQIENVELKKL